MAKLQRIIYHWTGGTHKVSRLDKEHYHFIIDGDGVVVPGNLPPEANEDTRSAYAAHTRGLNTGSLGVGLAGMLNAIHRPFAVGMYPLREVQVTSLVALLSSLGQRYSIPVLRTTMLGHAEVEPTLGVKQLGKWDITWLPGMAAPADPVVVGDVIRDKVRNSLGDEVSGYVPAAAPRPTIRLNSRGPAVAEWQKVLGVTADGIFGPNTQRATIEWQAAQGLVADGIVGPASWGAAFN